MKRVISTLSADTNFVDHATGHGVMVKGIAVTPNPNSFLGYGMGQGAPAVTDVSDDDAEFLLAHKMFKEHMARGFVKIVA